MIKHVCILIVLSLLSIKSLAGSSASCGSKITCKPGEKSRCEMMNGSSQVFYQASYLPFISKSDLFLRDLYAYKAGKINTVDCYYSQEEYPDNWVVFKSSDLHSVIPRDASEWVKRDDLLYCDTDLNSCLLYILY